MKTRSFLGIGIVALTAALSMTGCNKASEDTTNTTATEVPTGGLKIAYVEIDTLMS